MRCNNLSKPSVFVFSWVFMIVCSVYITLRFAPGVTDFLSTIHDKIIENTAPSPYAYRVLIPYCAESISYIMSILIHNRHGQLVSAYTIIISCSIFFSISSIYILLRELFSEPISIIGIVIVGLSMLEAFVEVQPWSLLEPGLYALGVFLTLRGHKLIVIPLIAIASFNRETAVFLILLIVIMNFKNWRKLSFYVCSSLYIFTWIFIYGGLRIELGDHPHEQTFSVYLAMNLASRSLFELARRVALFLGPFWFLIPIGWRKSPPAFKYSVFVFPLFVAFSAPFAIWRETRLWTPYYCVLIPIILYAIQDWAPKYLEAKLDWREKPREI